MAITRTAQGTTSDKSAGLTLTIASVTVDPGELLVVGLAYDTGQGAPDVTWGVHELESVVTQAGGGLVCKLYVYHRKKDAKTKTITATWTTAAPTAKAMFATTISEVESSDLTGSQFESATADPDSGAGQTSVFADEFFLGVIASEGPSGDTVGTVQNGYSSGQRVGTTGAGAASNVTVHEITKIVSATESTTAAKTGATSRDHCSILATFRAGRDHRNGITTTDLGMMREEFDTAVPELQRKNHAFHWNSRLDRWELYDIDLSTGTLVVSRTVDSEVWS